MNYYKISNRDELHREFQYNTGLNINVCYGDIVLFLFESLI